MESDNNMNSPLCANGCGFYGAKQNRNMCSKCYDDFLIEKLIKNAKVILEPPASPDSLGSGFTKLSLPDANKGNVNSGFGVSGAPVSAKPRCRICNKRVGLLGFDCRCGGLFCGSHRYPEEHECIVDRKTTGRRILSRQNPVCKDDKLHRRI